MRPRDVGAALEDALQAAEAVARFIDGRDFADYESDLMLSSAVERQLEVVAEALGSAFRADPGIEARLPGVRGAIGLRNVLAHDYESVSARLVWSAAREDLPRLLAEVRALLAEEARP